MNKYRNQINYNIGFCKLSPQELISEGITGKIEWMQHDFKDRFFADPFILEITNDELIVLAEECLFNNLHSGCIVELHIDKVTFKLKARHIVLQLNTHLSYPAIIRREDKVYVYPENSASGKLRIYEYDYSTHKLINPKIILDEAVVDATIFYNGGKWYLTATKVSNTRQNVFLYMSDEFNGTYKQVSNTPFNTSLRCSRPAGDIIKCGDSLFRPAQDCVGGYGVGTTIMEIKKITTDKILEEEINHIEPTSFRYSKGLHTINFYGDICVIDANGYLKPIGGRIYSMIFSILRGIKHLMS